MSELDVEVRPGLSSGHPDDIDLSIVMPCLNEARTVAFASRRRPCRSARRTPRRRDRGRQRQYGRVARDRAVRGRRVIHVGSAGLRQPPFAPGSRRPEAGTSSWETRTTLTTSARSGCSSPGFVRATSSSWATDSGRDLARGHALAPPLHRQPRPHRHPEPFLRQPDRRRPLRPAGVQPGRLSSGSTTCDGDGVRQRDGRQGVPAPPQDE